MEPGEQKVPPTSRVSCSRLTCVSTPGSMKTRSVTRPAGPSVPSSASMFLSWAGSPPVCHVVQWERRCRGDAELRSVLSGCRRSSGGEDLLVKTGRTLSARCYLSRCVLPPRGPCTRSRARAASSRCRQPARTQLGGDSSPFVFSRWALQ